MSVFTTNIFNRNYLKHKLRNQINFENETNYENMFIIY